MSKSFYSIFGALVLLISACGESSFYQNHQEMAEMKWEKDNILTFTVKPEKVPSQFQLYYHLRYTTEYDFCNIYTNYEVISPSGRLLRKSQQLDTLFDCKTGNPVGEGFGGVYTKEFLLEKTFTFKEEGDYQIRLEHYMRPESLEGVESVGVRLN